MRTSIAAIAVTHLSWAAACSGAGGGSPNDRSNPPGTVDGHAGASSAPSAAGSGGVGGGGAVEPAGEGGTSPGAPAGAGGASNLGGTGARAGTGTPSDGGGGAAAAGDGGTSGAAAQPSPGCATTTATTIPSSGRFTIDVGGTSRQYILALPPAYDAHHPYRLIFAFHGRMYSADTVANGGPPSNVPFYGIEAEAAGDAIFVAPQALDTSWTNQNGRDEAYVKAMLTRLESELCVDESRVFSTGFSMGAIMTITLGCSEGDLFRAIAPMSGSLPDACAAARPVPYWASHGTNDTTIPIKNGEAARDRFRTVDQCSDATVAGSPTGCLDYQGCAAGYPVTWCTFDGVHEPPPFSGPAIWKFLAQF